MGCARHTGSTLVTAGLEDSAEGSRRRLAGRSLLITVSRFEAACCMDLESPARSMTAGDEPGAYWNMQRQRSRTFVNFHGIDAFTNAGR